MSTYLVFGATGQTGAHFVERVLADGHSVRALVRSPAKLGAARTHLEIHQGSITESLDLDRLVDGVDFVVALLGDAQLQRTRKVNA